MSAGSCQPLLGRATATGSPPSLDPCRARCSRFVLDRGSRGAASSRRGGHARRALAGGRHPPALRPPARLRGDHPLGLAIALAQFDGINRLAASLLASGAIAAAILGFAARQTLANFVAGIMLAVTQPIRVGDWIVCRGPVRRRRGHPAQLHVPAHARRPAIVIPNEKLAARDPAQRHARGRLVGLDVALWLPATRRRRARRRGARARRPATSASPSRAGGRPARGRRRSLPAARARARARRSCGCAACAAARGRPAARPPE